MELVALLSSGKGTWSQVSGLMKQGDWEKIILIGDDFSKDNFAIPTEASQKTEFIKAQLNQRLRDLKEELFAKLKGRLKGTEVALSIASGDGKEHMALISSLLTLPVGIRFAALTKDGIIDL